jgi:hypothetical protein
MHSYQCEHYDNATAMSGIIAVTQRAAILFGTAHDGHAPIELYIPQSASLDDAAQLLLAELILASLPLQG